MEDVRGQFSSKIGFILTAVGSAVGLGNIWRFPYLAGENGGAVFVLLYLFFVSLIALPFMFAEFALGRATGRNPYGAINIIRPFSKWRFVGIISCLTSFLILTYYGVIAGWTFGYIFKMATSNVDSFQDFVANPAIVLTLFAIFLIMTTMIVYKGVEKGIERAAKILMPILFVLLFALIFYANSLEGSSEGLYFYLAPDFSKITGSVVLSALGQAFFSLSLGMGLMITYGSYLSRKENLISAGVSIAFFDTFIAIMAGLIIFPALFSMGENPASGPSLIFMVLPKLFIEMPGGLIVGSLFFVLLSIAALTSTVSMLEVPVALFVDETKKRRKQLVWLVAAVAFIIGIPSALSQGSVEFLTNIAILPSYLVQADFLSHMSFFSGDFLVTFGALLLTIFIGWVWGAEKAADELEFGSKSFHKYRKLWIFMIKYFVPTVIFVVLLNIFGIF